MTTADKTRSIGLIGLGLLGNAIASRLLERGWSLVGFDLDEAARQEFARLGGESTENALAIASRCPIVILCLPDANVSQQVLGEILPAMDASCATVIDTTTGAPTTMAENFEMAAERQVGYLDTCVGGSSVQMRRGNAVLYVGGPDELFQRCEPILRDLGRNIFPSPNPGDGARMKLVTNLVLGLNRAVLAEGLFFAQTLGLELNATVEMLHAGPAHSRALEAKGEKMVTGDFTPQARLSQHRKDVELIFDALATSSVRLPFSTMHVKMLRLCEKFGWGELDNSAIVRGYFSEIFGSVLEQS